MFAQEIMKASVLSVSSTTTVRQIAKMLMENGISGVPVIDGNGIPIGMVSESDLIAPDSTEKPGAGRDWWLEHLAEGEPLSPDFLAHLGQSERTARDVMVSPVMTVSETTDISEIARLFISCAGWQGNRRKRIWLLIVGDCCPKPLPT